MLNGSALYPAPKIGHSPRTEQLQLGFTPICKHGSLVTTCLHTIVGKHAHFEKRGPKTPGLIILEHELSDESVHAFIDNYPLIGANGWNPVSVAQLDGLKDPYQNVQETTLANSGILENYISPFIPSSTVPGTASTRTTSLSTVTSSTSPVPTTLATPDSSVEDNGSGLASNSASAMLTVTVAVLTGVLVSRL